MVDSENNELSIEQKQKHIFIQLARIHIKNSQKTWHTIYNF